MNKRINLFANYAEKIILASIVLFTFIAIGWILTFIIHKLNKNKNINGNRVYKIITNSIHTLLTIIGIAYSLNILGVNIAPIIAGLGLTGFAIGFALKDAVSNLIAGIMIVIYAPFDLNDNVEVKGMSGTVVDINLRYITLKNDSELVIIPNSNFITNIIKKKLSN